MKPNVILLVEDNPSDIRLTEEAFMNTKMGNEIHTIVDGERAIEFLERKGDFSNVPRPDIILLDLNLPKVSGQELLARIKQDPELKSIPVIILTGSSAELDILGTYNLNANCYITKPEDFSKYVDIARAIMEFWFTVVHLPA